MIISKNSKRKIYHEQDCPYALRMSKKYKSYISEETARSKGYLPCSYCGGMHGIYVRMKKDPNLHGGKAREGIRLSFDRESNELCLRTDVAFWKVAFNKREQDYRLYHLNRDYYDENATDRQLMEGKFHRQGDVKGTTHLSKLLWYIHNHDKAKKIMDDDWKKLPKATNKQRKYFKQAKKREQRKQSRRVNELLEMISKGEL